MSSQVAAVQNVAKPSKLGIGAISMIAEISSSQLGYLGDFDIVRVVRRLGGEIETKDFWGTAHDGSLEVRSSNSFTITVPFHTSIERDKFTVAHELGHFLLHYILASDGAVRAQTFYAKRYGGGLEEREANWFAASFLMPKDAFSNSFGSNQGNLFAVARIFGVSRQAAEVRARILGLFGDSETS
jgi:IrrE N-terminal-like domain